MARVGPGAMSRNLLESSVKARALYRDCIRASHLIVRIYGLDCTPPQLEAVMRRQFEKHRNVSDVRLADALIWKGRLELEETKALFKTKTHVLRYFPSKAAQSLADRHKLRGHVESPIHSSKSKLLQTLLERNEADTVA
eukprot:TRINITY_DN398_c0_g1_i1.p2 TRINITY_DN398_c0_g1~~TRINITY_DN398_c0_g1_i1.p2  ORF type:complete len:139 (-),score=36.83 TRINITY_DN398_c0_g1_i1:28-444(-)